MHRETWGKKLVSRWSIEGQRCSQRLICYVWIWRLEFLFCSILFYLYNNLFHRSQVLYNLKYPQLTRLFRFYTWGWQLRYYISWIIVHYLKNHEDWSHNNTNKKINISINYHLLCFRRFALIVTTLSLFTTPWPHPTCYLASIKQPFSELQKNF